MLKLLFTGKQKARYLQILLGTRFKTQFHSKTAELERHLAYGWQLCLCSLIQFVFYAIGFGAAVVACYWIAYASLAYGY